MKSLAELLKEPLYQAYSYSYPHKSAYRSFQHPVDLKPLWQQENRDALFLYLHVPFCEMRCGFCNLFALSKPEGSLVEGYLDALRLQAEAMDEVLGQRAFARAAIGGGTPTYLSHEHLAQLLLILQEVMKLDPSTTPLGIEVSPATLTADKLALLEQFSVDRISIGVQSFQDDELQALARRQQSNELHRALTLIGNSRIATLNIDLIYGIPGQTAESWLAGLKQALDYEPQELYLYPLYIRGNSGLGKNRQAQNEANGNLILNDNMLQLYRLGRDFLCQQGYRQISMRMFSKADTATSGLPEYSCQEDGMVGLGPGARSYTRSLHYSSLYASHHRDVRSLIEAYGRQSRNDFTRTHHGFRLTRQEQQHRHLLQSLFLLEGLDKADFRRRFQQDPTDIFPQLQEILDANLAEESSQHIRLNAAGVERADLLAPWLASAEVKQRIQKQHSREAE
jgi:oxygen-independent coproporphyrinogen-3 oxidase